jgi:hypothetical protein
VTQFERFEKAVDLREVSKGDEIPFSRIREVMSAIGADQDPAIMRLQFQEYLVKLLRSRGKGQWTVVKHGDGCRILLDHEVAAYANKRDRDARRLISRNGRRLAGVDVRALTAEELAEHQRELSRNRMLQSALRRYKRIGAEAKAHEPIPIVQYPTPKRRKHAI